MLGYVTFLPQTSSFALLLGPDIETSDTTELRRDTKIHGNMLYHP
jgi:hypothetical protein